MDDPDDRNWRDGLRWGLGVLTMAALTEGGVFLFLLMCLVPIRPREWVSAILILLALFAFGWVYGQYRPRR